MEGYRHADRTDEENVDARTTPLLNEDEMHDGERANDSSEAENRSCTRPLTVKEVIALSVSSLAGLMHIISFATISDVFIRISASLGIASAPLATIQQVRATNQGTLRETINKLREDAGNLKIQNDILHDEISALQEEVDGLTELETALNELAHEQGANVDTIMQLLKESKEIANAQKEILKCNALQSLIDLILEVTDDATSIDDAGLEHLIIGLRNSEYISDFHEDRFRATVTSGGGSTRDLLPVVKELLEPDTDESNAVITTSHWQLPVGAKQSSSDARSNRSNRPRLGH